jgi:prepilin-type N-terminal cleavage/methylation domain-containing protein
MEKGFSLIELLISMTITVLLLGIISSVIFRANAINQRETRRADALVSTQAALNVMSREIGNTGFGIFTDSTSETPSNGIVAADSNSNQIHFRSNFDNVGDYSVPPGSTVLDTNEPGEDLTYFFDAATNSIVRYDAHPASGSPSTSVIVNKISNVTFQYYNYTSSSSTVTETTSPTSATGRIRITVTVVLDPVVGENNDIASRTVAFTSDVTLRNSNYMLRQY